MKEKIFINLNQKEQIRLEQIIMDSDKKQALEFLKKVIKKKIDKTNPPKCKPVFEWDGKKPQVLTKMKEKKEKKEKK